MSYGYSDSIKITGLGDLQTKLTVFGERVVNVVTQQGLDDGAFYKMMKHCKTYTPTNQVFFKKFKNE